MKKAITWTLCACAAIVLSNTTTARANSAPVVSNLTVAQRTDGSRLVDIYYDLAGADGAFVAWARRRSVWSSAIPDGSELMNEDTGR